MIPFGFVTEVDLAIGLSPQKIPSVLPIEQAVLCALNCARTGRPRSCCLPRPGRASGGASDKRVSRHVGEDGSAYA